MVKPPLRTKSIGFKVSEEEHARSSILWASLCLRVPLPWP